MFYNPQDGHDLPHNPFNALIVPRPIAWISTRDKLGRDNLAPYSFFTGVSYSPPQIMFATTGGKEDRGHLKDTGSAIEETGVFCVNTVAFAMKDQMNVSSADFPAGVDEFERAGLTKAQCETIDCPRILGAPASLECRLTQIVPLKGGKSNAIFGEIVGVHIDDSCLTDGKLDVTKYQPLSRLGYRDYAVVTDPFSMPRPNE